MMLDQFIKDVEDNLTGSCMIPFKLKRPEMLRIIKYAKKWFYKNYENAVDTGYYVVPKEAFANNRRVKLDECIQSVIKVECVNDNRIFLRAGDMNLQRMLMGGNGMMAGYTNQKFDLGYFIAHQMYTSVMRSVLVPNIAYNFNFNTNEFTILGEVRQNDYILTCYYAIDDEALFEDELFYRWVIAESKIQLGRIISTIKMPLPGNAEIDYDSYKSDGKEEKDAMKEEIKKEEGVDYFVVQ